MSGYDIQLFLGMLVFACVLVWIAGRVNVPYPVLLVLGGAGISFLAPLVDLPLIQLRPDVVFLLFLPPLLYFDGMQTSWRDFSREAAPIALLSVGLVVVTVVVLAAISHYFVPGIPWGSAFVLGAVISPTDAIAASAITKRLNVPKRLVTILEGESLLNDATGLVAYNFAVAVAITGKFSISFAAFQLLFMSAGGVALGYVIARVYVKVKPRINNIGVETALSLLMPFIAYLPADWLRVSGVLSAVSCGLYVGRHLPSVASPETRLRLFGVWEAFVFILNAICFMLLGLQLPKILQRLGQYSGWRLLYYALIISIAAVLVRFAWVCTSAILARKAFSRIGSERPHRPMSETFFVGWTSMRGIVSLAAALAIPFVVKGTEPFPGRDLIVFITFGVILFTLVVQGLTLPLVIRTLKLPVDDLDLREERIARIETAHAAIGRLEVLALTDANYIPDIDRISEHYRERARQFASLVSGNGHSIVAEDADAVSDGNSVRRIALDAERAMLIHLRDHRQISDDVLRRVQRELDLEESRLG